MKKTTKTKRKQKPKKKTKKHPMVKLVTVDVIKQSHQYKHDQCLPLRERPVINPRGESASSLSRILSFRGKFKHNTELEPRISRLHPRKCVKRSQFVWSLIVTSAVDRELKHYKHISHQNIVYKRNGDTPYQMEF